MTPKTGDAKGTPRAPRYVWYGFLTLAAVAVAVALTGGNPERAWGLMAAWVVQAVAFWRLDRALTEGRDARKAWVAGMAARSGGLIVVGGLAFGGVAGNDLPVAYGIGMLVLLLTEAGWLAIGPHKWAPVAVGTGAENDTNRTRSTG